MWSAVGIMLNFFAYRWLKPMPGLQIMGAIIVGIVLGKSISLFGFSKIVKKNINRILEFPLKVCVFAFQEWKSYILIVVMMSMGIYLRTHDLLPKILLATGYIGIGSALFISAFPYYTHYLIEIKKNINDNINPN